MTRVRMKSEVQSTVVHGALALTLHVSRLLGVAPLRMERARGGWRVSVSRAYTIYSYLLLLALNTGLAYGIFRDYNAPHVKSIRLRTTLGFVIWPTLSFIAAVTATVGVYDAPNRMKLMIDYAYKIDNIQKKFVKPEAWKSNENKKIVGAVLFIMIMFSHIAIEYIGAFILAVKAGGDSVTECLIIGYSLETVMMLLVELQFVFAGFMIESSMSYINGSLKNLIYVDDLQSKSKSYTLIDGVLDINLPLPKLCRTETLAIPGTRTKRAIVNPDEISYIKDTVTPNRHHLPSINTHALSYAELCSIMKQVNGSFESPVMLLLSSIFVEMLNTVYLFVFSVDFKGRQILKVILVVSQILRCLRYAIILFSCTEPAQQIQFQVKRLRLLLSHMFRRTTPNDPRFDDLHFFFEQVILDQPVFTVNGLCRLRRSVPFLILIGVFTYMTFILQFKISA